MRKMARLLEKLAGAAVFAPLAPVLLLMLVARGMHALRGKSPKSC